MAVITEETRFDIPVDLRPSGNTPASVPATLRSVRNGMFELCASSYLAPGATLEVLIEDRKFESRIVCCERQPSGDFRLRLIIAGDEEKRAETRMPVDLPGVLTVAHALQTLAVRVLDISAHGLGFDISAPVPVGALVRVGLNAGMGVGEIRHCGKRLDRYRAGMQLHEFIVHPTLRRTIATNQAAGTCAPVAALVRSIEERQSRYEAILCSLASLIDEKDRNGQY